MKTITTRIIPYNNKVIELKESITFYSDGSYLKKGVRKYGSSNGRYLKMSLYDINGKEHKVFMHILMLCLFVSDRPSVYHEVDHIDRNTTNNDISNLRWVTRKLNIINKNDRKLLNDEVFIEKYYAYEGNKQSYDVVHHRVFNLGWDFEKAVTVPLIKRDEVTEGRLKGYEKRKTELRKWFDAQENPYNIAYKTFVNRINLYGYTKEEALNKPTRNS